MHNSINIRGRQGLQAFFQKQNYKNIYRFISDNIGLIRVENASARRDLIPLCSYCGARRYIYLCMHAYIYTQTNTYINTLTSIYISG